MKIMGHEYGLRYTVGAQEEISKLRDEDNPHRFRGAAQIPVILSEWNERAESLLAKEEGREYEPRALDYETVRHLTVRELDELLKECRRVTDRDKTRTVEEEPVETEKKTKAGAAGS